MAKIFKKENLSWLIPTIILIANIFIVYYGRIYFPNNFKPKETSFFENYIIWCLFEIGCIAIPALLLGMICLIIIMIIPKWNRELNLSIFNSWNPTEYKKIEKDIKNSSLSHSEYYKNPYPKQLPQIDYKYNNKIQITEHIMIETFANDVDFYNAVTPYDSVFGKTKNDIIKMLNDGQDYHYSIGSYFCRLKGITIQSKKEDIIKEIEKLNDFKWIRVSYNNEINYLTKQEDNEFKSMQQNGYFPNYNK